MYIYSEAYSTNEKSRAVQSPSQDGKTGARSSSSHSAWSGTYVHGLAVLPTYGWALVCSFVIFPDSAVLSRGQRLCGPCSSKALMIAHIRQLGIGIHLKFTGTCVHTYKLYVKASLAVLTFTALVISRSTVYV